MTILRVPVQFTYTSGGPPGTNVWHVRSGGATLSDAADDVATQQAVNAIHTFYETLCNLDFTARPIFPSGMTFTLGSVVDLASSEEQTPDWSPISSTGGENSAPPVLAVVVSWRTSIAARRGRGRTFIGPLGASCMQADGTISELHLGDIRNACTDLVAASTGINNWAIGVWGQDQMMSGENVTPEQRAAAPRRFRDVTGYAVKDRFAVLRSRRD